MKELLIELGEDPEREGLKDTPRRMAQALEFFTSGKDLTPKDRDELVGDALFHTDQKDLIVIKDIEVFSLCEHHVLPFLGHIHVAYIPNGKIIGLSKIPRLIDAFARRLQIQEKLTAQVADELIRVLAPEGVAVLMEAVHLCMSMRGVEKKNATTLTSVFRGRFESEPELRTEVLTLLARPILNATEGAPHPQNLADSDRVVH